MYTWNVDMIIVFVNEAVYYVFYDLQFCIDELQTLMHFLIRSGAILLVN